MQIMNTDVNLWYLERIIRKSMLKYTNIIFFILKKSSTFSWWEDAFVHEGGGVIEIPMIYKLINT